jgi:hypothetical protein
MPCFVDFKCTNKQARLPLLRIAIEVVDFAQNYLRQLLRLFFVDTNATSMNPAREKTLTD